MAYVRFLECPKRTPEISGDNRGGQRGQVSHFHKSFWQKFPLQLTELSFLVCENHTVKNYESGIVDYFNDISYGMHLLRMSIIIPNISFASFKIAFS